MTKKKRTRDTSMLNHHKVLLAYRSDGIVAVQRLFDAGLISKAVLAVVHHEITTATEEQPVRKSDAALAQFCEEHTAKRGRKVPPVGEWVDYLAQMPRDRDPHLRVPLHHVGPVKKGQRFQVRFGENKEIRVRRAEQ